MKTQLALVFGSILLLSSGILLQFSDTFIDAPKIPVTVQAQVTNSSPEEVKIPSVNIDLSLEPGGFYNGKWVLSETTGNFMPVNANIAAGDGFVVYAHKRVNLFISLKNVKKGDKIIVMDNKNKTYTYDVYNLEDIRGNEVGKVESNEKNTIVLFTCDGVFDEKRLVVRAKRI